METVENLTSQHGREKCIISFEMSGDGDFSAFVAAHKGQLVSSAIPERHWNALFVKLKDQVLSS